MTLQTSRDSVIKIICYEKVREAQNEARPKGASSQVEAHPLEDVEEFED